jgi:hypothetical protein
MMNFLVHFVAFCFKATADWEMNILLAEKMPWQISTELYLYEEILFTSKNPCRSLLPFSGKESLRNPDGIQRQSFQLN